MTARTAVCFVLCLSSFAAGQSATENNLPRISDPKELAIEMAKALMSGDRGRYTALAATPMEMQSQYQGWSGVITSGVIGGILGAVYFASRCNLWVVIVCHGLVDTIGLMAIYFDRRSWICG